MISRRDTTARRYKPLKAKTLQTCLARRIGEEFPRIGGPRILGLCAEMILDELSRHLQPFDTVAHGQIVWLAVAVDDPPSRAKRIANTRLVPVILDLFTAEDADDMIDRLPVPQRYTKRAVRMCRQAHSQGGLLSNADLAMMLVVCDSRIAHLMKKYETDNQTLVPRRATLHDMGSGLTHKAVICRKRYQDGKTADEIAKETHHSIEAVDRYLGQYDRVRNCRLKGMNLKEISFILKCGERLVQQYLDLDRELSAPGGAGGGS